MLVGVGLVGSRLSPAFYQFTARKMHYQELIQNNYRTEPKIERITTTELMASCSAWDGSCLPPRDNHDMSNSFCPESSFELSLILLVLRVRKIISYMTANVGKVKKLHFYFLFPSCITNFSWTMIKQRSKLCAKKEQLLPDAERNWETSHVRPC